MKTYRDEHEEMLEALRKGLEEFGKLTSREAFEQLVADGLIDREGRLRPEITGIPDSDDLPGPQGK